MLRTESITLRAYLVGPIWYPTGMECYHDLTIDLVRGRKRFSTKADLRDLLSHIVAEHGGDFVSCSFAQASIEIVMGEPQGHGRYRVLRSFPLADFPSAVDYCHPDSDWWPASNDDD
jgi:hypothetical protein